MKKVISILVVSTMILCAFAGCDDSATSSTASLSSTAVSSKENSSDTKVSTMDYNEDSEANGEVSAQFYGINFTYSSDLGLEKDPVKQSVILRKPGVKKESIGLQYLPSESLDEINSRYQELYDSMKENYKDFYPNFSPTYSPSKMGLLFSYNYTDYMKSKIKADCEIFSTTKGGAVWMIYSHSEQKSLSKYYKEILESLDKGAYEALTGDKGNTTSIATSNNSSSSESVSSSTSSQSEGSSSEDSQVMNLSNFQKIQTGMSYKQVSALVGEGTVMSQSEYDGTKTVIYEWYGAGSTGANANAMFQNDKLVSKSQFGLS
ncbi:MAG: DUF3862 domain-containing protein [Ruminococcaceae bacterium]|jgi:hypothetical protein|nr:DUF3862 domain-containing protein [Oscillospiraceae bacterium]